MLRPSAVATVAASLAVALAIAAPCHAAGGTEAQLIERVLGLRPGMTVADVGAGSGEFTTGLARAVGSTGRVYATEIEQRHLAAIDLRMQAAGHRNVITVLGTLRDAGLAEGCCDRILLRLVYHHFSEPAPMRDSLLRALRPGGRIAVVDLPPQPGWRTLPDTPDRGGHGIQPEVLRDEMLAAGWQLVERHDEWPGEPGAYCLVFEPAPASRM